MFEDNLLNQIRTRFHHVDRCPYQGPRIFFENAGGSLTLKTVTETGARLAAIPDNQGRDNPASREMVAIIERGRQDMRVFLGATGNQSNPTPGHIFIGESGTDCLFRAIRAAALAAGPAGRGGRVIGSTLEHPATMSAAKHWAAHAGLTHTAVAHDPATGTVTAAAYQPHLTADTRVATIIHTSPVTGIAVDVAAIAAAIRAVSPACFIIVDGIQHAPHGAVSVADYGADAYAVSAYKVFSQHNYGFAWLSDALAAAPHDHLHGAPPPAWELGTRAAAYYATFSEVVQYLDWLGAHFTPKTTPRDRLQAAATAIHAHEQHLTNAMLTGTPTHPGLTAMPEVTILGGANNPNREGLVSLAVRNLPSAQVVTHLATHQIRTHTRKPDHYSTNILTPLGLPDCVRVSLCHYNTLEEVDHFLFAIKTLLTGPKK